MTQASAASGELEMGSLREKRLLELIEGLEEAVYRMSLPDGRYEYFSESIERVSGYTRDMFLNDPAFTQKIVHPDSVPYFIEKMGEMQAGYLAPTYEFKIIDPEGKERWMLQSNRAISDKEGKMVAMEGLIRNITEYRQAEAELQRHRANLEDLIKERTTELRQSERAYQQLYDSFSDGLASVSMAGYVTECNPAFEKMVGYSLAELQQIKFQDLTPAKWHDMEAKILAEQALVRGYTDFYQKEYIRKDGVVFPVELAVYTQKDETGNINGFWGFIRDITKKKEDEEKQKELEHIANQSPAVFFRWRAAENWPVEFVSDNVTQFGYTPADFYSGRVPYGSIVHPNDLARVGAEVIQYSQEPNRAEFAQQYRIITKTGEIRWTDDRTWIRRDAQGNITHYQGIIFDITERQQAEIEREQMLKEQRRLAAVLDNTSDLVGMIDMQGNSIYVNPAGMAMMGRVGQNPTSLVVTDFHPPEAAQRVQAEHLPAIMKNGHHTWENVLQHADGHTIPVSQASLLIYNEAGEPEAMATIMRDISGQKQSTAEREQLQQEIIDAQRRALQELSTPIIPVMEQIIVMPLIGSIDSMRARDITRTLLAGIRENRAKVVILDITGVPLVDSGVASHLNKTIQAARLKGARTIVTGVSDAVAETVVDLGIDWSNVETLADLQTGLVVALASLGVKLTKI